MANPIGTCCICGITAPLSFEHVPPKAAFNDRGLLFADIEHHFSQGIDRDPRQMRRKNQRKGSGRHSLCERCNNFTGGSYVNAYIDWVDQLASFRRFTTGEGLISLPFAILPGRVFKQIIAMFATVCGEGFFRARPELTRYVLDRSNMNFPTDLRVQAYFIAPEGAQIRMAGITGMFSTDGGGSQTFAEISFPPVGYLLTLGGEPRDKLLTDITFFSEARYDDFRVLHLKLPMRSVASLWPGDFRSAREWNEAINRPRDPAVE